MADKSTQAKTEKPTQKHLQDLRKKGDVPKSADVPATAVMIVGTLYLSFAGMHLVEGLTAVLDRAASADFATLDQDGAIGAWTRALLVQGLTLIAPFIAIIVVASALASFAQVGAVFSLEAVKPNLDRISPFEGLKRIFSARSAVELTKLLLKTLLLGIVIWLLAKSLLPTLLQSHRLDLAQLLALVSRFTLILAASALAGFALATAFDVWFQRWDYRRRHKMSIEEVRREQREMEGDPHIRSRRRQIHQEVTQASMLQNLRKASVVVVNPTHIAVALYYAAGETDLPIVVAKGEGDLARQIRRIAEEEGIPIMQNVDLARRLQASTPIDQYIPEELIEPVAAVLRWAQTIARDQ